MAKMRITLSPGGVIRAAITEGTYEDGAPAVDRLIDVLQAQGVTLGERGAVEQHRHDDPLVLNEEHVHD